VFTQRKTPKNNQQQRLLIDESVIPDSALREIFLKCVRDEDKIDFCLVENSVAYLITEEIDEADIRKVKDAITRAKDQVKKIKDYLAGFKSDAAKAKLNAVSTMADGLESALATAEGQIANVSLSPGAVSAFFGEKLTLPQIMQGAITLQTKAEDFYRGLTQSIKNITDNLAPLVKDEDKDKPLSDIAGTGNIPDFERLLKGFQRAMQLALKKGFFQKIASFFGTAVTGAEKKMMDKFDDMVDADAVISSLSNGLLDVSMDDLEREPPTSEPGARPDLGPQAKEAEEEQSATGAAKGAEGKPGAGAEAQTGEDAALKPADLKAADEDADKLADALGAGPVSKKALTALLKKYPEVTGKGNKATYQRRIFRKAVNKAAGKKVFEEALLAGSKTAKSDDSEIFDRWKALAGIGV